MPKFTKYLVNFFLDIIDGGRQLNSFSLLLVQHFYTETERQHYINTHDVLYHNLTRTVSLSSYLWQLVPGVNSLALGRGHGTPPTWDR